MKYMLFLKDKQYQWTLVPKSEIEYQNKKYYTILGKNYSFLLLKSEPICDQIIMCHNKQILEKELNEVATK